MKKIDNQFINILKELIAEATKTKGALLEVPKKKKTIREKIRERKSGKTRQA